MDDESPNLWPLLCVRNESYILTIALSSFIIASSRNAILEAWPAKAVGDSRTFFQDLFGSRSNLGLTKQTVMLTIMTPKVDNYPASK